MDCSAYKPFWEIFIVPPYCHKVHCVNRLYHSSRCRLSTNAISHGFEPKLFKLGILGGISNCARYPDVQSFASGRRSFCLASSESEDLHRDVVWASAGARQLDQLATGLRWRSGTRYFGNFRIANLPPQTITA